MCIRDRLVEIPRVFLPGVEVISINFSSREQVKNLIPQIKSNNFDLGIIFPVSFSSAFILKKAGVEYLIGYNAELRGFLLDCSLKYSKNAFRKQHLKKSYGSVFTQLTGKEPETYSVKFSVSDVEKNNILSKFGLAEKPYFILSPGAAYGAAKRWNFNYYIIAAKHILDEYGYIPVLTGIPEEVDITIRIPDKFINLIGKTSLVELICITESSKLFISNDSGSMHIADILGVPLIAIFGSTNPDWTGPTGNNSTVLKSEVSCSPCYKKDCKLDFICLNKIQPEHVLDTIRKKLKDKE